MWGIDEQGAGRTPSGQKKNKTTPTYNQAGIGIITWPECWDECPFKPFHKHPRIAVRRLAFITSEANNFNDIAVRSSVSPTSPISILAAQPKEYADIFRRI